MRRFASPPPSPAPLPVDVRLMNTASSVFAAAFALLAVVLAGSWLVRHQQFDLSAIQVQGDLLHTNAVTLRANVTPRLDGNFFTVNLVQTRAVFESVPWVRKATVQRQFPDRLKVVLEEHQAAAFWGPDGDTRLLNNFGEVFEANQAEVEGDDLPQLSGPPNQAPMVLQGYRLVARQFEKLAMPIERFELTGQGSWRAAFEGGATIELGQGTVQDIDSRTQRFIATLGQVSARFGRDLESADLRYSNGYAVKLKGVTTVQTVAAEDKKVKR